MKLAIVGSRSITDFEKIEKHSIDLVQKFQITHIVSGGAKGVDSLAATFAAKYNLKLVEHLPDWKTYGKSAGFIRNARIVDDADVVIAFWDGTSKGTLNSIQLAKKHNKTLKVIKC